MRRASDAPGDATLVADLVAARQRSGLHIGAELLLSKLVLVLNLCGSVSVWYLHIRNVQS